MLSLIDFEWLVSKAVLAPSGHNTQPWRFKPLPDAVEIHPDFSRTLPVVDPKNRELFISLGCAAENLCIAATQLGYCADVMTDEISGVIRIALTAKAVSPSSLFAQIPRRQTNRSIYNGNIIPEQDLITLQQMPAEVGTNCYFYAKDSVPFEELTGYILQGNQRQMQNAAFKQELKSWMRYNKKHQDSTRDGLSYAVFGAPDVPRFIAEIIMSLAINEKSQNRSDRKKTASASHFVLFTVKEQSLSQWVNLGRTLQRFLLKSTELGIVHSYFNQPCEESDLAARMAFDLGLTDEHPAILLRLGYGGTQAYSLRRGIGEVIMNGENTE